MTIAVVGLGLIGGSIAKAYKRAGFRVLAANRNKQTERFAVLSGAVDEELTDENMKEADVIFICVTIDAAVEWLKAHAEHIGKEQVVIDCCGIKRRICKEGKELSSKYGFMFIGGHPMAGKQFGGFRNSTEKLFDGATMILIPEHRNDIEFLAQLKYLFKKAGFRKITFMTAEQHDEMIAFTSQMTHIAANAFVKNEEKHPKGFTEGGSFRDFTRVAFLDDSLWTDLFLENRDNLIDELEDYISELEEYRKALIEEDEDKLKELLQKGTKSKVAADRKNPALTMEL